MGQEVCLVCLFVEKLIHKKEQMHYVNYLYTLFTPEIEPLNYILLLVIIDIIVVWWASTHTGKATLIAILAATGSQ